MEQRRNKTNNRSGCMFEVENLRKIGRGGNSEVFLGVRRNTGKYCVIKRSIDAKFSGQQLENEGRILEYLKDSAYKYSPDLYYYSEKELVMEYIEGTSLDRAFSENLNEKDMIDLFERICMAVEALHELRPPVIHMDIKPSNFMVDKTGKVYLIDFGTAKIAKGYDGIFDSKLMPEEVYLGAGTRNYAAPEQYGGLSENSFLTDVFQVGKTIEFFLQRSGVSRRFSEDVMKVVRKCCASHISERYLRISDIRKDLLSVRVRNKRHVFCKEIFQQKDEREKCKKVRKKAEKPELFIDVVRTFDTIEFL
ncbi:serine/threonine protein kinase [Butyrivibrio sp. VCD2006]|uniref:serine/threonine protein kinase n=1 Tax=Butyrivibrio sp. VCD2006 TaxID=1280664 RepID=UPI0009DB8725|nr:AarF/UbiB family protein [Butyrivibrio sp. VCD2006]